MRLTDEGYMDDEDVVATTGNGVVVDQLPLDIREGEYLWRPLIFFPSLFERR